MNPLPSRGGLWAIAVLIGVTGALLLSQRGTTGDVGLLTLCAAPVALGLLAGLGWPDRAVRRGLALSACTLLFAAPLMGEGAICLIVIAPWHLVLTPLFALLGAWATRRWQLGPWVKAALAAGLLTLVVVAPRLDARLMDAPAPITLSDRVVLNASPEAVWASVERLHLDLDGRAPLWMRALLPVPREIRGGGADPGAERRVIFDNGTLLARVVSAEAPRRFEVALSIEDAGSEFFDHWIVLERSTFTFEPLPDGRTAFTHTTTYRPRHAPRWYFAPIERALGGEIQGWLLEEYGRQIGPGLVAAR